MFNNSSFSASVNSSEILLQLKLQKKKYFLVSSHREENVDYQENLGSLLLSLNSISEEYGLPVIVSTHPRTKDRLEKMKNKIKPHRLISFLKPMGFFDYINLQKNSYCVI